MKLFFLVIAILINFFNHSLIKSQENIDSANKKIDTNTKKESITKDENEVRKIHIVKMGETISNISKLYSINKDLIIKLNNLKDENNIYVGQNLIISGSSENSSKQSDLINNYHIVQIGESLTEISNKYKLNLEYLIEINNLKNPDSIKVGQKLLLRKKSPTTSEIDEIIADQKNDDSLELNKKIYGPVVIENKSFEIINGRKVLNVFNKKNKKLFLSIDCDKEELDVRIPGREWRGEEPAKEEFEKNLINDFC